MRRISVPLLFYMLCLLTGSQVQAQYSETGTKDEFVSKDSITKGPYTLIYINKHKGFADSVKQRMIKVFFEVYPVLADQFNRNTRKKVVFVIDPAYTGVAATSGGVVRYNPKWFEQHPGDIDVVTHEVMHIVQNYGGRSGPGWVTEGIADYVRYVFGVDNKGGGWSLPPYSATQRYDNSYRVTARFLAWIEKHIRAGFVKELDNIMRTKKYSDDSWKQLTGKTVDELWQAYAKDPAL